MPARPGGNTSYPVLVHRLVNSIRGFPWPVALPQLRFTSLGMTNSRWDFHPQERAHAWRTTPPAERRGALDVVRTRSFYSMASSTRSGGAWPSQKVLMLMMTFSPISTRPSMVADPI